MAEHKETMSQVEPAPPAYNAQYTGSHTTCQQQVPTAFPYVQSQPVMTSSMTQPIVIQMQKTPKPRIEKYNGELSWKLGIIQLVIGGLCIVLNCTGISISATSHFYSNNSLGYGYAYQDTVAYYIGTGVWVPLLFVSFSAAYSLCAAKRKTKCRIVANMVFGILSSIFTIVMLGFALWALITDVKRLLDGFYYNGHLGPEYAPGAAKSAKGSLAVSVMWMAICLAQFVVCVWSATLCCRVTCCENSPAASMTEPVCYTTNSTVPGQRPQVVVCDSQGRTMSNIQVIQLPAAQTHTGGQTLGQGIRL